VRREKMITGTLFSVERWLNAEVESRHVRKRPMTRCRNKDAESLLKTTNASKDREIHRNGGVES